MAIKETVASLAAKRGYLVSEVAEEMDKRGYDKEAHSVLTGKAEGCYVCTILLADILDLDAGELKEVRRAFHQDAEERIDSWSIKTGTGLVCIPLAVAVVGGLQYELTGFASGFVKFIPLFLV